jgi:hypothetical protein
VRLDHLLSKEPNLRASSHADGETEGREGRVVLGAPARAVLKEHSGLFDNHIASVGIFVSQVRKGIRWMPWRQKARKDVAGCDKPRGAAEQALIRGCPNGETRQGSCPVICG